MLLLSTIGFSQPAAESASKIVFVREANIYTVNPDGSGLTRLTAGGRDHLPDWSPNGSRIAFRRGFDVWVMDSHGSNQVRVAASSGDNPEHPMKVCWAPDGSKIAFATNVAGYQGRGIFVVNADGSNLLQVAPRGSWPRWSPDGSRIVFTRTNFLITADADWSKLTYDIYTVKIDGSGLVRLTDDPAAVDVYPVWSPWLR